VQKKNSQHGLRDREQRAFQKQQDSKYLVRASIILESHFKETAQAAQQKNEKIDQEKASVPVVDSGNDNSKPYPHHT
jgi:hypothetical protein